jgi:quinol-cytochrome oxidoreductase complex cytochrome b subunit
LLTFYYNGGRERAYPSISQTIIIEVNGGWLLRSLHFNGARVFFILVYLHLAKALYYGSYRLRGPFLTGLIILLVLIAIAFLGYRLLNSQIRFWAGVVIRGLLRVIRNHLVTLVWGSYTFGLNALRLFFSLHYITPFILGVVIVWHLMSLHTYRRTNPLGLPQGPEAEAFYPSY